MRFFVFILLITCQANCLISQFYDTATMAVIHNTRTAYEGDMYLDTALSEYRIGLTHGRLGTLNDDQMLDTFFFRNDSLHIEIEDGADVSIDFSEYTNYPGDIEFRYGSTDGAGWYLLDGRAISSLPANAQVAATALGFATNLPDMDNRVLKAPTGAETMASTGGNVSHTLTQANIPNYNLPTSTTVAQGIHFHIIDPPSTATSTDGAHTHDYEDYGDGTSGAVVGLSNTGADDVVTTKTTQLAGAHIHTLDISIFNSSTDGDHTHDVTVNSGGTDTPFDLYQPYNVANAFIFLGR